MSQGNVEVVRRIYEAFARADLTTLLESVDPAIRCYDRPSRPGADVYLGQIGFLRFWQTDREVFEAFGTALERSLTLTTTSSYRSGRVVAARPARSRWKRTS